MTFEEAEARYATLRGQHGAGLLPLDAFHAAVSELRIQDASGAWWQIDAVSGGWLRWSGTAWLPAQRPSSPLPWGAAASPVAPAGTPFAAPVAPAPSEGPTGDAFTEKAAAAAGRVFAGLRQRTQDPAGFLAEARQTPIAQRSQSWWDTLSILGGAVSGYLWFVYGSVRGMPLLKVFSSGGRESWFDLVPTVLLLALPFAAFIYRVKAVAYLQTLWMKVQHMTSRARAIWAIAAVGLAWWVQNDTRFFQQREGLDFITPAIMVAIPTLLVWFRPETDQLLMPLQAFRQKLPRGLLVVAGLAAPYAVAYLLYGMGFRQYPYLRYTVTLGTLLSYAILRTPQGSPSGSRLSPATLVGFWIAVLVMACTGDAVADDFLRDPFNLNDGLRTQNIAQVLAGSATVIVSVLVNGVEVARTILYQPPPPGQEGPGQQNAFQLVVNSFDAAGARSVDLVCEGNERIYIYAHCEQAGAPFPAGDPTISFSGGFDRRWASLDDLGMAHGQRCACVSLLKPMPAGDPPTTLPVTVTAGSGGLVSAPVLLRLTAAEYILELS